MKIKFKKVITLISAGALIAALATPVHVQATDDNTKEVKQLQTLSPAQKAAKAAKKLENREKKLQEEQRKRSSNPKS